MLCVKFKWVKYFFSKFHSNLELIFGINLVQEMERKQPGSSTKDLPAGVLRSCFHLHLIPRGPGRSRL